MSVNGHVKPPTIAEFRRRVLQQQARRLTMRADREAGELVSARDVEYTWARSVVRTRTKLLGLPSRIKQQLPHLTASDLAVIDTLIRQALEELATDTDVESKV